MKRPPIYYWIDHTAGYASNTGMQRVTRSLSRALVSNGENVVFVRWSSDRNGLVLATRDELLAFSRFNGPQLSEVFLAQYPAPREVRTVDEAPRFARGEGWLVVPEVTHITYHERPATLDAVLYAKHLGLRSAFIFYDAIPLKLADYAAQAEAHAAYMQQIAVADAVLPISRFAAEDLVDYLMEFASFDGSTLPAVRPVSLPGEVPGWGRARGPDKFAQEAHEIIILSVGTLEPRKNQLALIEAFDRLCADHPDLPVRLILVGHLHPAVAEGVLGNRNPRMSYLEYVDDAELASLFRRSHFTVYPSVEEGFGLPILESLWHGKPCVCADFGAMEEVARDGGCLRVDVRSPEQLRLAMERLLTDEGLRSLLAQEACARRLKTWAEYAREVSDVLDEISSVPRVNRLMYWVDHTCKHPSNSGIQRVVRLLAKSLVTDGVEVVPITWDAEKGVFASPGRRDLEHLARWSGPSVEAWARCDDVNDARCEWLLIPELTTYADGPDLAQVTQHAASLGMRSAILFYDALPVKMSGLYPPEATAAHRSYMAALNGFHRVIAISEMSRVDLREFWMKERSRLVGVDARLVAVSLPGEFPGSARTRDYHASDGDDVIKILSVGTIEPRKNQITMIKAFLKAQAEGARRAQLTLVGSAPIADLRTEIEGYVDRNSAVTWIGEVDDEHLRGLYSSCHFTIYPSLGEGFGLPVVESLWHGRPCVCRDHGALAEAAQGGGCVLVDTADEEQLAGAIGRLINDDAERERLGREATARTFKTWQAYGREVLTVLSTDAIAPRLARSVSEQAPRLRSPLLSICVTTYNRAAWLEVSLRQLAELVAPYRDVVELVVCDNASSDDTAEIAAVYRDVPGVRYYRNPANVGMLGNLRETVHHARGRFVWILGDDDIVKAGSVEKILSVIIEHPAVALIYLNYAYTHHDSPKASRNLGGFLASAVPIARRGDDRHARIADLATASENFFTAIYCLVFRRDHAIRAYSQDVVGPPFSSLLTCVPTAHYVCNHLFQEMGYWVGEPCVVVNLNVSWARYAPVWVLERLPELYDLAEMRGADPAEVDRWRVHNLPGALHYLPALYFDDDTGNLEQFSFERFVRRHTHLPEFQSQFRQFVATYRKAYEQGRVRNDAAPTELLERFGLSAR